MELTELIIEYRNYIIMGFVILGIIIYNLLKKSKKEIDASFEIGIDDGDTKEDTDDDDDVEYGEPCLVCGEEKLIDDYYTEWDQEDKEIWICNKCIERNFPPKIVEKEVIKSIEPNKSDIDMKDIMGDLE